MSVGEGLGTHAHHWVLESPHGSPLISGVCRSCGITRTFRAGEQTVSIGELHTSRSNRSYAKNKDYYEHGFAS